MQVSTSKKTCLYDLDDVLVSSVEYPDECGMTLIYCPTYMDFYISKRGKDISGISLDMNNREGLRGTKAICLVGGSSLGLEAVCGVNKSMLRDNNYEYHDRALGVCCYTTNLILNKKYIYPDLKLGEFAFDSLSNNPIPIGQVGVGKNSATAKMDLDWRDHYIPGGQGVHFIKNGKLRVLVIINLNSIGVVHEKNKLLVPYKGYKNLSDIPDIEEISESLEGLSSNTTLTTIITNVILNDEERQKMGEKFHDVVQSMIYPYGTIFDGDTLFLASTHSINIRNKSDLLEIGSECIIEAIKSVF